MSSTTPNNQAVFLTHRFLTEVYEKGTLDSVEEMMAETVKVTYAYDDSISLNREELKSVMDSFLSAFNNIDVKIPVTVSNQNMIATQYTIIGTHEGRFLDIEPTENEIQLTGIDITRIEDELITEMWRCRDMLSLLSQLGVVDDPYQ